MTERNTLRVKNHVHGSVLKTLLNNWQNAMQLQAVSMVRISSINTIIFSKDLYEI